MVLKSIGMDDKDRFGPLAIVSVLFPGNRLKIGGPWPRFEHSEGAISLQKLDSIQEFEKRLGIPFEPQQTAHNLCMADNPEVRLDFRNSFDQSHVLDYIQAVLHTKPHIHRMGQFVEDGDLALPYPPDLDLFWKLVAVGGEIRRWYSEQQGTLGTDPFPAGLKILAQKVDTIGIL